MNIKLTIEYNGAGFSGWQRQPGQRTIQSELEEALKTYLHQDLQTTASGRTDKGVHAKAQVVSFELESEAGLDLETGLDLKKLTSSLNGICPEDLRVISAEEVVDDFNARLAPHLKCYCYALNISGQRSPLFDELSLIHI